MQTLAGGQRLVPLETEAAYVDLGAFGNVEYHARVARFGAFFQGHGSKVVAFVLVLADDVIHGLLIETGIERSAPPDLLERKNIVELDVAIILDFHIADHVQMFLHDEADDNAIPAV